MRRRADPVGIAERAALALSTIGLTPPPLPKAFFDGYLAPIGARALIVATRVGVFGLLAERPATAAEVAAALELDGQACELLLDALLNLGYVRRRRGGRLALTRTARRWLVPGTWDAVVGGLGHDAWELIEHLEPRLRGDPPAAWHDLPGDDARLERYQRAMAQIARVSADAVARSIPVSQPRRLLDLGGSHGLHAAAMCRRHPGLRATVMDLAAAVAPGRATIAAEGMADRVEHVEGDIFSADLGSEWDLITAHALLHNFGPERNVELLSRAHAALGAGGTLAALEIARPAPGARGSRVAALGALLFHTFGEGRAYRPQEVVEMATAAGFRSVAVRRPRELPASFLVLARR